MKATIKSGKLNRVLMAIAFLFVSLGSSAQEFSWNECVDWLRNYGVDKLAAYARPMYAAKGYDYKVIKNSNDAVVQITYEPLTFLGSRTLCIYKVIRGSYNGRSYFYDVEVERDPLLGETFNTWNAIQQYGALYENFDLMFDIFDGVRSFSNLPLPKKAAAALTMEFFSYVADRYR